jgi:hypothetical protein
MFNFMFSPAQTVGPPPSGTPGDPIVPDPLTNCTFGDTIIGGDTRVSLTFSGLSAGNKIRFSVRDSGGTYYVTNWLGGTNSSVFPGISSPSILIPSGRTLHIDAIQLNPTTLIESAMRTFNHII